jgi:hypothetical protein
MSKKGIITLASAAGFFLALAGILFPLAVLPGEGSTAQQAKTIQSMQVLNLAYVACVTLSNILITPVLALLTFRLFPQRKLTSLISGTFIAFMLLLETAAVLVSVARWPSAIPGAAAGEVSSINLFETLQVMWLVLAVPGILLFYIVGAIFAVEFWEAHRPTALAFGVSVALFLLSGTVVALSLQISAILYAASIVVYGIAYPQVGRMLTVVETRESQREFFQSSVSREEFDLLARLNRHN